MEVDVKSICAVFHFDLGPPFLKITKITGFTVKSIFIFIWFQGYITLWRGVGRNPDGTVTIATPLRRVFCLSAFFSIIFLLKQRLSHTYSSYSSPFCPFSPLLCTLPLCPYSLSSLKENEDISYNFLLVFQSLNYSNFKYNVSIVKLHFLLISLLLKEEIGEGKQL